MIDFDGLVLVAAMDSFAQPITLTPAASQPGAPAYQARGVYASKPVQIALEDGTYHSTVQPTLGVRLGDFAVAPMQGDIVAIGPLGSFMIADVTPDGQGGADCVLRAGSVPAATTLEDGA